MEYNATHGLSQAIAQINAAVASLNLYARSHPQVERDIRKAHEYTFTHAINVGILTMSQAEALGFRGAQLHHIGVASILHDVGKLFIPEEILSKPAALTPEASKRRLPEIAARATLPSDSPGASVIAEGDGGGAGGQRIVPAANLPAAFNLPVSRSDQPLAAQNRAL